MWTEGKPFPGFSLWYRCCQWELAAFSTCAGPGFKNLSQQAPSASRRSCWAWITCLATRQLWAGGLILHKELPWIPSGLLVEQWMQDWVRRECKLPGNYSHPWFWYFHFKTESTTRKIPPCLQQILLMARHCISMSGFSFFFFPSFY